MRRCTARKRPGGIGGRCKCRVAATPYPTYKTDLFLDPVGRVSAAPPGLFLIAHAHRFGFTPAVQPVRAEVASGAGLLHAAERQVGVNQRMAVHPDGTRLQSVGILQRLTDILRPDAGGQAIFGIVGKG